MPNNQVLIRDVDRLDISPKAKHAAKELIELIDMPVVFDLKAPGNKSMAGRMPGKHNQFWVTVVSNMDRFERERIILAHLFRGVTDTLRFPSISFNPDFLAKIQRKRDHSKEEQYKGFIRFINSFVSTIICEAFLIPYGLKTGMSVRKRKQMNILYKLKNYASKANMKRSGTKYITLVMEMANQCRICANFEDEIHSSIKKDYPYQVAQQLLRDIESVKEYIQNLFHTFSKDNSAECMKGFYQFLLDGFKLGDKLCILYPFAYKVNDREEMEKEEITEAFSFVPEDIGDSNFFLKCIRYANTAIVLAQEYYHYLKGKELPDVHIFLAVGKKANAYAQSSPHQGNSIIISDSLFRSLKKMADDCDTDDKDITGYRERRLKLSVFLVTLHEFAHIINGDCKTDLYQDWQQETKADLDAKNMLNQIIPFQFRPGDSPIDYSSVKAFAESGYETSLIPECWRILEKIREQYHNDTRQR